MIKVFVPRVECVYVQCRMLNLCVSEYCVGAALAFDGIVAEHGEIKTDPERAKELLRKLGRC